MERTTTSPVWTPTRSFIALGPLFIGQRGDVFTADEPSCQLWRGPGQAGRKGISRKVFGYFSHKALPVAVQEVGPVPGVFAIEEGLVGSAIPLSRAWAKPSPRLIGTSRSEGRGDKSSLPVSPTAMARATISHSEAD